MRARRSILIASLLLLAATHGELRAADSCPESPLFHLNGPTCSASRQNAACGCSECMLWDPSAGAEWYEIRRCNADGTACVVTGDTRFRKRSGSVPTMWCMAWDSPFPVVGSAYDYAVRACKAGTSGALCATGLSNPVRYVAAPYLCLVNGLEVPCSASGSLADGDADADGITDALDADDDRDGLPDATDNCPQRANVGQRDFDRDGIGDACDPQPLAPTPGRADVDGDHTADVTDVCPWVPDAQADRDGDRTGDACDNCPDAYNEIQADADGDGEGNACDTDDGSIMARWTTRTALTWDQESVVAVWNVYRGDLGELRRSGSYTQEPGTNPQAGGWCDVAGTHFDDPSNPASQSVAFYLIEAGTGNVANGLGVNSAGTIRQNSRPCP